MKAVQIFTETTSPQGYTINDYKGFSTDPTSGLVEFVGGSGGTLISLKEFKLALWGDVEPVQLDKEVIDVT